jgi:hypothetical protein
MYNNTMNTGSYIVRSRVTPFIENVGMSKNLYLICQKHGKTIKNTLIEKGVRGRIPRVGVNKFFVEHYYSLKPGLTVEDVNKCKEDLEKALHMPYVQIRYPRRNNLVSIEIPNYRPKDILIYLNIYEFDLYDFHFLKAVEVCRFLKHVSMAILQHEIDDTNQYLLERIVDFINKEEIVKKEEIDYGEYWYKWRERE